MAIEDYCKCGKKLIENREIAERLCNACHKQPQPEALDDARRGEEIAELIGRHNDLLLRVCEKQRRDDADRFLVSFNAETGFFDRAGGSYDADDIKAMIGGYEAILAGNVRGYACKPNPYDGVWK